MMQTDPHAGVNVSAEEISHFDKLAARWWDPDGESRPLHDLNPVRAAYVARRVDLRGARVADVTAVADCSARLWRAPAPRSPASI